jgi:hypothetical protein
MFRMPRIIMCETWRKCVSNGAIRIITLDRYFLHVDYAHTHMKE